MKKSLLSLLCALCVFFFLLTAAIGLPIYIRPFYYAHIEAFDLARVSGYSEAEIREAYDEVLDYLLSDPIDCSPPGYSLWGR